jgi:hypothetical protein
MTAILFVDFSFSRHYFEELGETDDAVVVFIHVKNYLLVNCNCKRNEIAIFTSIRALE